MRRFPRLFRPSTVLAPFVALIAAGGTVDAQRAPQAAAPKPIASIPRLSDGRPDLQGVWGFATVTPLQRPKEFAGRDTLTADEIAAIEQKAVRDQFVDVAPPPGNPGAYNRFWIDAGTKVVGTGRTSLIVDPPDGRLPPLSERGRAREKALETKQAAAAGPEDLTTWDRCLLGFNAGPPLIGGGYNAYVQLFQTGDHFVMHTEMVHDARIIPLDGRPALPAHMPQWKGSSRGRWEGDTLIIETRGFRPEGTGTLSLRGLGLSPDANLRLTERFRRLDADTLAYEYTVDDPTVWTRPWTVSMTLAKSDQPIHEYACHEGNYGLTGILSGARATEPSGATGASREAALGR
jgi:hypothetical protein